MEDLWAEPQGIESQACTGLFLLFHLPPHPPPLPELLLPTPTKLLLSQRLRVASRAGWTDLTWLCTPEATSATPVHTRTPLTPQPSPLGSLVAQEAVGKDKGRIIP